MWISKEKYYSDLKEAKLQGFKIMHSELLDTSIEDIKSKYDSISDIDNEEKRLLCLKNLYDDFKKLNDTFSSYNKIRFIELGYCTMELPGLSLNKLAIDKYNMINLLKNDIINDIRSLLAITDRNGKKVRVGDKVRVQVTEDKTQYLDVCHIEGELGVSPYYVPNGIYWLIKDMDNDQWEKVEKEQKGIFKLPPIEDEVVWHE